MKTVLSYPFSLLEVSNIKTPKGAEFVGCAREEKGPYLYMLVNSEATEEDEQETRSFYCIKTGWTVDEELEGKLKPLGSFIQYTEQDAYHLFEVIN